MSVSSFMLSMRTIVAVFVLLTLTAGQAARADFEADILALGAKKNQVKIEAIANLAADGHAQAVPVLEAFLAGRLFLLESDERVVIASKATGGYALTDAISGADHGTVAKTELKKIRINNRLRKAVKSALGGLTLFSADKAQRLKAANALFKSRPGEMLAPLEKAFAAEQDDGVKSAMLRTLSAIRATRLSETETRVAALGVLAGYPVQDVRALIGGILNVDTGGKPVEPDAAVRAAAKEALDEIEGSLKLWGFAASVFQGISLGSVLLLAAIGLAITFGVMGVINMAHGEMVMLGAYTTYVVQDLFKIYLPGAFDFSLLVAIPAAFMVAGTVGIAVERGIIRFLYGRPLETLLATWGLSLLLQQCVRTIFGSTNQEVANPSWMSGALEVAGGLTLTYNRIWIIAFSLFVLLALMALLKKTDFGLQMRAVTQNREMAASMGIRTGRVDALTFGLGSGIAGMAGVALSQIDNVSPNLGQAYIIDSFMVVVFGGVGNLWGTLVGALSLGVVNKFLEPYAGAVLGKILVLVLIILFIQRRPRGLFAQKGRAVEQ